MIKYTGENHSSIVSNTKNHRCWTAKQIHSCVCLGANRVEGTGAQRGANQLELEAAQQRRLIAGEHQQMTKEMMEDLQKKQSNHCQCQIYQIYLDHVCMVRFSLTNARPLQFSPPEAPIDRRPSRPWSNARFSQPWPWRSGCHKVAPLRRVSALQSSSSFSSYR